MALQATPAPGPTPAPRQKPELGKPPLITQSCCPGCPRQSVLSAAQQGEVLQFSPGPTQALDPLLLLLELLSVTLVVPPDELPPLLPETALLELDVPLELDAVVLSETLLPEEDELLLSAGLQMPPTQLRKSTL